MWQRTSLAASTMIALYQRMTAADKGGGVDKPIRRLSRGEESAPSPPVCRRSASKGFVGFAAAIEPRGLWRWKPKKGGKGGGVGKTRSAGSEGGRNPPLPRRCVAGPRAKVSWVSLPQ